MKMEREPQTENVEGAPTLIYELWTWQRRLVDGRVLWPEEQYWQFIGYRVLTLRQVLNFQSFGYHVERSHSRDRNGTLPLFPRLDATPAAWGEGLD